MANYGKNSLVVGDITETLLAGENTKPLVVGDITEPLVLVFGDTAELLTSI